MRGSAVTRVVITEENTGARNVLMFRATCDGEFCGQIDVYRRTGPIGGRVVWPVNAIFVATAQRRKGVATKLYEAAAQAVCKRRGHMASTNRSTGAHSHDFWQKQVAKGRARVVRRRHGAQPAYILTSCPVTTLAGRRRR